MKKGENLRLAFGMIAILSLFMLFSVNVYAEKDLSVNTILLKTSIKEGGFSVQTISVSSVNGGAISVSPVNLAGVDFNEESFILAPGETRNLNVSFNTNNLKAGVYAGSVLVKSSNEELSIPVILEVETKDVFFDSNVEIPPAYSEVISGSKIVAQIKFFDLTTGGTQNGLSPSSVEVAYSILRADGAIVLSERESIVIDDNARVTRSVNLPKDIKAGDYLFAVQTKYGSSVGVSSGLFKVSVKQTNYLDVILGSGFLVVVIIVVILIFIWLFFVYFLRDRDKLILELKKYNDEELKRQKNFLEEQQKLLARQNKYPAHEIKNEVREKIKKLVSKQKHRVQQLRELKKKGAKSEMMKKLQEWKKQGYNTLVLESKLKALHPREMQKILSRWKRQGYSL